MQASVYVTASGPALSLLLYENTKSSGNQMGFLLGAVVNQVTDTISDSQIRDEKTETIINISSILPISSTSRVINGAGRIDKDKLNAIVRTEKSQQVRNGSESHDIVGWYSFKRNEIYQMSMREQVIHLQLIELAKGYCHTSTPELFVLCLLSSNLTSKATHVFKHSFMRYLSEKGTFDLIPLQIHNLGMPQSTQYQNTACAPSREALLKEIFERVSPENQGRDHMLSVQSELQILLNQRVRQLSDAENSRIKLESEVEVLKKQCQSIRSKNMENERRQSHQGQSNGSEDTVLDSPKQCAWQNNHNRSHNRNADGDASHGQATQVIKTEGHFNNDRTSPVLGTMRHHRSNRPHRSKSPELKQTGS